MREEAAREIRRAITGGPAGHTGGAGRGPQVGGISCSSLSQVHLGCHRGREPRQACPKQTPNAEGSALVSAVTHLNQPSG